MRAALNTRAPPADFAGEFDAADRHHGCGFPVLRIEVAGTNYYPTAPEVRELSFLNGVTWPDFRARFPNSDWVAGYLSDLKALAND